MPLTHGVVYPTVFFQAREYAVEAEVEKQIRQREAEGEPVDVTALEADPEIVRGVAVASGLSDAEFKEEVRHKTPLPCTTPPCPAPLYAPHNDTFEPTPCH